MNNRTLGRSILVSAAAPWLVYLVLRPRLGSDPVPLAVGGAIPVLWALGRLVVARKADWIAIGSAALFAVTVVIALHTNSSLPIKIKSSFLTGVAGLVLLVSIAVERPLLMVLARMRHRSDPASISRFDERLDRDPAVRRRLTRATAVLGATFLLDAVARAALALTVSTATFLVASPPVSWGIILAGLTATALSLGGLRPNR
jgi:hypothetical protein